jgi:CBS domain-containing protein
MRPSRSSHKWHAAGTGGRTEVITEPRRLLSPSKFRGLKENEMNAATILKSKGSGVVTATANESLLDIAKLLVQHGIGCIVIVGDDDKIAGIVSERDLVRAIGQSGAKVLKEPVSDFMTNKVVTAREADTVDRLMSEMTAHRFRHMPVVERGRLIGLVSIGDLVKMHVADAEFESGAMRQYITSQPGLLFDQASRLRLAGGA